MIPITDTPKRIPITLSDTDTLSDFSSHWQFSQPTQEFSHYTEGPCFPHKQTGHWVIPMTLRDTLDTEWYPLPWVLANRISDGRTDRRTHRFSTQKNPILLYIVDNAFLKIHWCFFNTSWSFLQIEATWCLLIVFTSWCKLDVYWFFYKPAQLDAYQLFL